MWQTEGQRLGGSRSIVVFGWLRAALKTPSETGHPGRPFIAAAPRREQTKHGDQLWDGPGPRKNFRIASWRSPASTTAIPRSSPGGRRSASWVSHSACAASRASSAVINGPRIMIEPDSADGCRGKMMMNQGIEITAPKASGHRRSRRNPAARCPAAARPGRPVGAACAGKGSSDFRTGASPARRASAC